MAVNYDTDDIMGFVYEYMAHHDNLDNKERFLMTTEEDFLFVKNRWESFKKDPQGRYPQWLFDFKAFGCILSGEYEITHNIAKILFTTNIQEFVPIGNVLLPKNSILLDEDIKDYYYILTKSKIHPNKKFSEGFILSMCDFFDAKYNDAARRVILHSMCAHDLMLDDTYYHSMKKESREKVIQFLLTHPDYEMNKKKNVSSPEETPLML